MSEKMSTHHDEAAMPAIGAFAFPQLPFNLWGPALACSAEWNTSLFKSCATLTSEWQDFVSRRVKEDIDLMQRIGACRSPDQVWAVYAAFWQKAAEDYSQEFATMARLTGNLANRSMASMQRQLEATASEMASLDKAA